ncbi:hypothetical protein DXG01_011052 [Tephrocybe rancida]|nr:hypothetical protein DXG01_011052 [Tephrocybe rancida]
MEESTDIQVWLRAVGDPDSQFKDYQSPPEVAPPRPLGYHEQLFGCITQLNSALTPNSAWRKRGRGLFGVLTDSTNPVSSECSVDIAHDFASKFTQKTKLPELNLIKQIYLLGRMTICHIPAGHSGSRGLTALVSNLRRMTSISDDLIRLQASEGMASAGWDKDWANTVSDKEFSSTSPEERFVADLTTLNKRFREPLLSGLMSLTIPDFRREDVVHTIFQNIEVLTARFQILLDNLRNCQSATHPRVPSIMHIILNAFTSSLLPDACIAYIASSPIAEQMAREELDMNPKFQEFLDLLEVTSCGHPDHAQGLAAMDAIHKIATTSSNLMERTNASAHCRSILASIAIDQPKSSDAQNFKGIQLGTNFAGTIIKSGEVVSSFIKGARHMQLVLTNAHFYITQRSSGPGSQTNRDVLVYKPIIACAVQKIIPAVVVQKGQGLSFKTLTADAITLSCATFEIRDQWIKALTSIAAARHSTSVKSQIIFGQEQLGIGSKPTAILPFPKGSFPEVEQLWLLGSNILILSRKTLLILTLAEFLEVNCPETELSKDIPGLEALSISRTGEVVFFAVGRLHGMQVVVVVWGLTRSGGTAVDVFKASDLPSGSFVGCGLEYKPVAQFALPEGAVLVQQSITFGHGCFIGLAERRPGSSEYAIFRVDATLCTDSESLTFKSSFLNIPESAALQSPIFSSADTTKPLNILFVSEKEIVVAYSGV